MVRGVCVHLVSHRGAHRPGDRLHEGPGVTRRGPAGGGESVAVPERGREIPIDGTKYAVAQSVEALEAWGGPVGPFNADAQVLELRHVDPSSALHGGFYYAVIAAGREGGAALPNDRGVSTVHGHCVAAERVGHLMAVPEHDAVAGRPLFQRVESGPEAVLAKHNFHAPERRVRHLVGGRLGRTAPDIEAQHHAHHEDERD